MSRTLRPQPLTTEAFAPYGEVIETHGQEYHWINQGRTQRFHDLAAIDVAAEGGRPLLNIFRSKAIAMPFAVKQLERHPLGSQTFVPLHGHPFLVLVAKDPEDVDSIELFISNGEQGVSYRKGVWHHYQLSLAQDCEYLVIDRGGAGNNCDEYFLQQAVMITV